MLGLFGRNALAKDQGRPEATLGTGAMTLAQNFPSESGVDVAFAKALSAGAEPLEGVFVINVRIETIFAVEPTP